MISREWNDIHENGMISMRYDDIHYGMISREWDDIHENEMISMIME